MLSRLFKNRDKRKRAAHIGAGIVILIHAYEKYESGHHTYLLFAIAGVVFLTIAWLHPVIEKKAQWVDGVFFVIEGILSVVVACEFFYAGKKALPATYLLLALFQFFMAVKRSKKGMEVHSKTHAV